MMVFRKIKINTWKLNAIRPVWIVMVVFISGCASVPDAPKLIDEIDTNKEKIQIEGVKAPMPAAQADRLIKKIEKTAGSEDVLQKHLAVEQEIADTPLVAGNNAQLLFDGEQTFTAIFNAINSAKYHINLEYFIFENVKLNEVDLQTLLLRKRAEGVEVNVIYDAFGSSNTPKAFFDVLREAGVKFTEYHPLNLANLGNVNRRDHRKILVIDGKLAIVGGVNLSTTYQSKSFLGSSGKHPGNAEEAHWRDTDMRIEGPVVAELQKTFLDHWDENQPLDQSTFFPAPEKKGNELIRIIGSSPMNDLPRYYVTLISAIQQADIELTLSSAYFVPTPDEKTALIKAASRGVKVDLFVPGVSDSTIAMNVQRSHYEDLLESGINIYESETEVLHAKTITVDGVWSVIGSSNFDYRSAALNAEVDIVVLGGETANELKQKFNTDILKAKKITLHEWNNRSIVERMKEFFSRIFQHIL